MAKDGQNVQSVDLSDMNPPVAESMCYLLDVIERTSERTGRPYMKVELRWLGGYGSFFVPDGDRERVRDLRPGTVLLCRFEIRSDRDVALSKVEIVG